MRSLRTILGCALKRAMLMFENSLAVLLVLLIIVGPLAVLPLPEKSTQVPHTVHASGAYNATGGELVVGSERNGTSGASSGNVRSWKGTIGAEGFYWEVDTNSSTGLNQQLTFGGVELAGANKLIFTMTTTSNSASLNRLYQICDWVSNSSVDTAADSQCTTGGWRTMNAVNGFAAARSAINSNFLENRVFHIYDGYWTTSVTGNTSVSTPISNFIKSGTGEVRIRFYSTDAVTATHRIDNAQISVVVDPVYFPAAFTKITGGTVTNSYTYVENPPAAEVSGSYLEVPGTGSVISDFYLSYKNVKTYTGQNTILVRSRYSCSTTGINIKPKIYNFNSASWEDLTSTTIACSATDATSEFAKNNVTISNYISSGEIRIGWYGSAANTLSIRLDYQYLIVGTTNSNSSDCEISFGTGTATDCTHTRDYDSTITPIPWSPTTELESTSFGHTYNPFDNDVDNTSGEAALGVNVDFDVSLSSAMTMTAIAYAYSLRSNSASVTLNSDFRDYSGTSGVVPALHGGWVSSGATGVSGTSYSYIDTVTVSSTTTAGYFVLSQQFFYDPHNDEMNMRIRTETSTLTSNVSPDIDFLMIAPQWIELAAPSPTLQYRYISTGGTLVTGTETTITSGAGSGNVGSSRGLYAFDGYTWTVTSDATNGLNQQVSFGGVSLQGANKMIIALRASASANTLSRLYQICDWSNSSSVDNTADAQCTGGGWRTFNMTNGSSRAGITTTSGVNYAWHIYDGYWTTSVTGNTSVSTPISNFIKSGTGEVLIRSYSASAVAVTHTLDVATIDVVIDPVYTAGGFTQITGDTVSTSYINTESYPTLTQGNATTGSDNVRLQVPGTGAVIADFYLSYNNVEMYTGANTILVRAEYGCSTTGINIKPKIYNFNSASWEDLTSTTIACSATDAANEFAKNNITMSHYVSGGEIRIGWYGSAANTLSINIDYQYVMIGTTNTDSSACLIDFGTGTATDCTHTRDYDSLSRTVWSITSAIESTTMTTDYYPFANDGDSVNAEHAEAAIIDFSPTLPTDAALAGIAYAASYRSNISTLTLRPMLRDWNVPNTSGGWFTIGAGNAATTYTYTDSIAVSYVTADADDYYQYTNDKITMRFRTSSSTRLTAITGAIDFAMVALRWVEAAPAQSISMSISDNTIGFGTLTSASSRYASGDGLGSSTEVEAHTIIANTNASSGYTLQISGTTLTAGVHTIDAIGASAAASSAGTEQFGIRAVATGGSGAVISPYNTSNFALDTATFPDTVATAASGDGADTTYSVRYIGNVSPNTQPGSYSTTLTYILTSNF